MGVDGFALALGILTNFFIAFEQSAPSLPEPVHTTFHLLISASFVYDSLTENEIRNLCNEIVKHIVESQHDEDGTTVAARYSYTKQVLLDHV